MRKKTRNEPDSTMIMRSCTISMAFGFGLGAGDIVDIHQGLNLIRHATESR
jgi:hypothetical protein